MPGALGSFSAAETISLVLAGVLAVLVAIMGYRAWNDSRIPPAERERQRRAALVASGKMGDAVLVELRGELLFYSYEVRGVQYTASQDISQLKEYLPAEIAVDVPAVVRYHPRNPANSIVISERWSGVRGA